MMIMRNGPKRLGILILLVSLFALRLTFTGSIRITSSTIINNPIISRRRSSIAFLATFLTTSSSASSSSESSSSNANANANSRKMTSTSVEQDNVNKDWNEMASSWDDMGGPKQYRDAFVAKLEATLPDLFATSKDRPLTILDFGCGTGLLTEALREKSSSPGSQFIMIDPAIDMTKVVQDKISTRGWNDNTKVYCIALSNIDDAANSEIKKELKALRGKVDVIVASSVMSFIPKADLAKTMQVLGELLKPGTGTFVHSDWPYDAKDNLDGFTEQSSKAMYEMGGLTLKSSEVTQFKMGGPTDEAGDVYFGVAEKK